MRRSRRRGRLIGANTAANFRYCADLSPLAYITPVVKEGVFYSVHGSMR